jgi:hypothetical protein
MRTARVFDGSGPDGPYFAPGHPLLTDPVRRERVATFLGGGRVVLRTTAYDTDRWDPERDDLVPLDTVTDGTWIWSTALHYYVVRHGLAPEPEFLAHMAACDYLPHQPDEDTRRAVVAHLRSARR